MSISLFSKKITGTKVGVTSDKKVNNANVPQSFCMLNKNCFVVFFSRPDSESQKVQQAVKFNASGKKIAKKGYKNLHHVNGATYCSLNNKIYVCHSHDEPTKISVINADTLKHEKTLTFKQGASGIAFDPITQQFYITRGSHTYVLPYKNGLKVGNFKSVPKSQTDGTAQDCGGYNGVIMECRSGANIRHLKGGWQKGNRVDCYSAKQGKYLGSYEVSASGEVESIFVNPQDAKIWTLINIIGTAGKEYALKNGPVMDLQGKKCEFSNDTVSRNTVDKGGTVKDVEKIDKEKYIKKYGTGAEVYFELKEYGYSHKACCAILGNMEQESGIRVYTGGSFDGNGSEGLCQWTFGRKTKMQKYAEEHSSTHNWMSVDGQVAYLVYELKHSYSTAQKALMNESLTIREMVTAFEKDFERAADWAANINKRVEYAQKWDKNMKGAANASGDGTIYGEALEEGYLQVSPEKLYSSDNYKWLELEKEESDAMKALKSVMSNILNDLKSALSSLQNITSFKPSNTEIVIENYLDSFNDFTQTTQMIKGDISGASLPIATSIVEAPFIELTLGGVTFGTCKYKTQYDSYPNYVQSINVSRVNGSINQYTINLIHQILPGDNPNYIDELISKTGYDEITLSYGDSNSNVIFRDEKAMVTSVSSKFDFVNCNIQYTINATSLGLMASSSKQTFEEITDKPSNIIRDVLYSSQTLLSAFPGMVNQSEVENMGLIPTNDKVITVPKMIDTNPFSYIKSVTALMENVADTTEEIGKSSYYLTVDDGSDVASELGGAYFKICEVKKINSNQIDAFLYEVDLGYPDDNMAFNFSVQENYEWPIAYASTSDIEKYNYNLDYNGLLQKTKLPVVYSNFNKSGAANQVNKNLWTQLTEFPVSATLTLKGLAYPLLLMTYIKVNSYYFGSKRISSGIYVVTGQTDTLDSGGYKTTLALTRVTGDDEYSTIDGRVAT